MKNLRNVDLNLLVAVDAFIFECSVTRAATRLGLSQPAASNMLRRLRATFEDEILVRSPSGLRPTERASELHREVVPILRSVSRLFESSLSFDPLQSRRQFIVRMSDILEVLVLPALMSQFTRLAPLAALEVLHLSPEETIAALEGDRIDLAVSMGLAHSSSIQSRILFPDKMVCVMRRGHRAAAGKLTLERFLAERHVRVSISPTDRRFVDNTLTQLGVGREISFQTQHWTAVPSVLANSDLLAVMPASFARGFDNRLIARTLPFDSEPFDWNIYWHLRHSSNPGLNWLINLIAGSATPDLLPQSKLLS